MARKKKGSGKPRKKTAGKKTSSRSRSKSGSSARRPAGAKKAAKRKPARKKAAKKAPSKARKKAPARKKAAAKRPASSRKPAPRTSRKPASRKPRAPGRDKAFFEHFRNKLLEQRQQITRRLDELRAELQGLEETPRELEEWAQEEKDRDILIRLEDRETDELRKIQAALGLIDQQQYGYCQICGKPIPRARLEELPTAFRCVDCTP
ncbi:MAG TPA: TraR/DksA family transcriptional regulator [Gemmatimonadota bacterium]|jgi:DnaK suppressor protein